jgi:hypothetical protein
MSNNAAIGANTNYPMANMTTSAFATPYQTPYSSNVIAPSGGASVNPSTGELNPQGTRLAGGGTVQLKGHFEPDGSQQSNQFGQGVNGYQAAGSGGGGYSGNQQNSLGVSNPQIPQRAFTGNQAQTQIQGAGPRGPANFDTGYLQTMQNVFGLPPNLDQRQQPFDMSHYEDGSAQNFFNSYGPAATSNRFSQEYQKNQAQNAAQGLAAGGLTSGVASLGGYASGGNPRLLRGPGDGMSDNIPAQIGNKQPARLADGEFVVPADVVSHLGNGSSDAGAKQLYAMMDKIRQARTGRKAQGKQINPNKFMPA